MARVSLTHLSMRACVVPEVEPMVMFTIFKFGLITLERFATSKLLFVANAPGVVTFCIMFSIVSSVIHQIQLCPSAITIGLEYVSKFVSGSSSGSGSISGSGSSGITRLLE